MTLFGGLYLFLLRVCCRTGLGIRGLISCRLAARIPRWRLCEDEMSHLYRVLYSMLYNRLVLS